MAADSTGTVIGKSFPPTWLSVKPGGRSRSKVRPVIKMHVFLVAAGPTGTPFDSSKFYFILKKKRRFCLDHLSVVYFL